MYFGVPHVIRWVHLKVGEQIFGRADWFLFFIIYATFVISSLLKNILWQFLSFFGFLAWFNFEQWILKFSRSITFNQHFWSHCHSWQFSHLMVILAIFYWFSAAICSLASQEKTINSCWPLSEGNVLIKAHACIFRYIGS